MTDRELLELAAKAAGIGPVIGFDGSLVIGPNSRARHWNPLEDDGDALRLAVKLEICVVFLSAFGLVSGENSEHGVIESERMGEGSTRRAIVRAAAEIGMGMACSS